MAKLMRLIAHLQEHPVPTFSFSTVVSMILPRGSLLGVTGLFSGIPNFAPLACIRLWELLTKLKNLDATERAEAARIQSITSQADVSAVPGGIRAMSKLFRAEAYSATDLTSHRVCSGPKPRIPHLPSAATSAPGQSQRRNLYAGLDAVDRAGEGIRGEAVNPLAFLYNERYIFH